MSVKKRKKKSSATAAPAPRLTPTSPLMRAVDRHYAQRLFGAPDGSFVFDAGDRELPYAAPRVIDVAYWEFEREPVLTRIATIGMGEVPLVDGARIELHMSIGRELDPAECGELCLLLSCLAAYPFHYETDLKPDQFLSELPEMPCWPGMSGILIDELDVEPADRDVGVPTGERIHLLRAIPVTSAEIEVLRARGAAGLKAAWAAAGTDVRDPGRASGGDDVSDPNATLGPPCGSPNT